MAVIGTSVLPAVEGVDTIARPTHPRRRRDADVRQTGNLVILYRKLQARAPKRVLLLWIDPYMRVCSLLLVGAFLAAGCNPDSTKPSPQPANAQPLQVPVDMDDIDPRYRDQATLLYDVLVAEIAGYQGNLEQSLDFYLEAAQRSSNPAVAERAARIALFARNYPKALQAVQRWVELAPENIDALRTLAVLHLREGQLEQSAQQLERVLALAEPDSQQTLLMIARLLARENDAEAALKVMGMLAQQRPDDPHAAFAHANLALQSDHPETALASIERALQLKPEWPEASLARAHILVRMDKVDEAIAGMKPVLKAHPDSRDLRIGFARLLAEAGRFEEARKQFDSLLKQSPNDPDLLYTVALLSLEGEHLDLAERYLKRLLKTGKRTDDANYFMGVLSENREQPQQAMNWYRKVSGGERALDAHIRIAALLAKEGKINEARDHLHRFPAPSEDIAARLILAELDILRQAEQYEEAMRVADEALERLPQDNDLLYARAMLAEKVDRLDLLESDLKRILEQDPDNAHALNALGYTLADRTQRYQEALEYIQRAYELSPEEPAILDSMGWVHYRLGDLDSALKFLRQAFEAEPDAEIAAHLGEVLWVSGAKDEARQIWDQGRQDDPENRVLVETMNRLTP